MFHNNVLFDLGQRTNLAGIAQRRLRMRKPMQPLVASFLVPIIEEQVV